MPPPDLLPIPTLTVAVRPLWVPQMLWSTAWKLFPRVVQCGHGSPEAWEFSGTRGGQWEGCWWSVSACNVSPCMWLLSRTHSVTSLLPCWQLLKAAQTMLCSHWDFLAESGLPLRSLHLVSWPEEHPDRCNTHQCYRKPDRDFATLSLSLDHCLPFSPPPLWLPSLLLFIAIFLEPSSATKGRGMTRKVRIVASCDCSPPGIPSARGSSYWTEPLMGLPISLLLLAEGKAVREEKPSGLGSQEAVPQR